MTVQEALFSGPCMYWKQTGSLPKATLASQLWMSFRHDVNRAGTALCKKIDFSPLLPRYITVPAKNMANDTALGLCLAAVDRPAKKDSLYLKSFGTNEGFRIAQDIVLNPRSHSGLCVGMCLEFLTTYFSAKGTEEERTLAAAKLMQNGASPNALGNQLLYDALMPIELPQAELEEWQKVLENGKPNVKMTSEKESLLKTLHSFMEAQKKDSEQSLRKYVLQELKGISPEIYSIVIHLDSVFFAKTQKLPLTQVHTQYNCDIKQTLLNKYGVKFEKANIQYVEGSQESAIKACQALVPGAYLLVMPQHNVVLIKTNDGKTALFDPLAGTAILAPKQTNAVLSHFFQFYFFNQAAQFPIIPIK